MIVGGNIAHYTRVMTTAIALETAKGDLPLVVALGITLLALTLVTTLVAEGVRELAGRRYAWRLHRKRGRDRPAAVGTIGPRGPRTLPLSVDGLAFNADGRPLLAEDMCFTVQLGTFNVILGPSGAGKTLLLRLRHGLLQPHGGRIA